MARPKTPKEKETKTKKIALSMTPSFYAEIKAAAEVEQMSFNGYVTYVLQHRNDRRKK